MNKLEQIQWAKLIKALYAYALHSTYLTSSFHRGRQRNVLNEIKKKTKNARAGGAEVIVFAHWIGFNVIPRVFSWEFPFVLW